MSDNPLLKDFNAAPFAEIEPSHFKPAIEVAIAEARAEIEAIAQSDTKPSFENTLEALEYTGLKLERIAGIFFNLNAAETNAEIQSIAQDISPILTKFHNDITLNEALFERIRAIFEQGDTLNLNTEQKTLLEKKYKHFKRNGALLKGGAKEELREIDEQLAKMKLTFGERVLAETNAFELHITEEADLEGLPAGVVEAAAQEASNRNKKGWVFTLNYPSYLPFMKYAKNRDLRKQMYLAFGSKGFKNNDNNNQQLVRDIAHLRHRRAQLLGFENHAHFVLEERMAETPERVMEFLNELLEKAKPAALRELEELRAFAEQKDNLSALEKWDSAYYSEQLKNEKFSLDDEKLKPYFKLENVIEGVFEVSRRLFGLTFKASSEYEVYHPEVQTYEVYDDKGKFVALFYADFHPRPGKRNGAWMTSYRSQYRIAGEEVRPHISNVCNFTRPTPSRPSLLTFNEITTLFHEFGHALHGMLAATRYPSLSGTSVYWDFVELPSQIMENWCYEEEALKLFARNYETGEPLPMEYIDKIKASANFQEGMATLRQVSFGLLDMAWHSKDPSNITDVKAFEEKIFTNTQLLPPTPETCMSTAFSHIFQGGYASGYYSYKWAEVLDADAFAFFKEQGIFNPDVAARFRDNILSKGGTEEPMVLYKRFRGREPRIEALLERAGLI